MIGLKRARALRFPYKKHHVGITRAIGSDIGLFLSDSSRNIVSLDPAGYEVRWEVPARDSDVRTLAGDTLVASSWREEKVYGLDADTGKPRWAADSYLGSCNVYRECIIVASDEMRSIRALNSRTGVVEASIALPAPLRLLEDGRVVCLSDDSACAFLIDLATQETLWQAALPVSHSRDMMPRVLGIGEHLLLVQAGSSLLALDSASGALLWEQSLPTLVGNARAELGGIFVPTSAQLVFVDLKGAVRWQRPMNEYALVNAGHFFPCVFKGHLAVVGLDHRISLISPADGAVHSVYRGPKDIYWIHSWSGGLVVCRQCGRVDFLESKRRGV